MCFNSDTMSFSSDVSSSSTTRSPDLQPNSGLFKDFLLLLGIIAMFTLLWPAQGGGDNSAAKNLRIVFEATSGSSTTAETLLERVESAQKNFGAQGEITVIGYWDGVRMFRLADNPLAARLESLADSGVDFIVGEQSMKDSEMPSSDLLPFARTVKSGAEEARRMEKQGWARVRDGDSYVSPL